MTSGPTPPVSATPSPDIDLLPPLRSLVITEADVSAEEPYSPIREVLDTAPISTDVSTELADHCLLDCAKTLWQGPNRRITILMVRAGDHAKAVRTAESLRSDFQHVSFDWADDRGRVDASIDNTFIYFVIDKIENNTAYEQIVLGTVRGPIVLLIVADPNYRSDDLWWQMYELVEVANLQLAKLAAAGYPN